MAFKPDGSILVLSVGKRLIIIDAYKGIVIKVLKGHKENINSVTYSFKGFYFASGASDTKTIIWNEEGKGILKFSHAGSVQVVVFNPTKDLLASCSNLVFGYWSPKSESVTKHKVSSKILCASWSLDGQSLAIGMATGLISIRDDVGVELAKIERSAPIWTLSWVCQEIQNELNEYVVIGSWDKTVSIYERTGIKAAKDRKLDFYPYSITNFGKKCEYFLICGSDGRSFICRGDSSAFKEISQSQKGYWTIRRNHSRTMFACSDNEGNCSLKSIKIGFVYDEYYDRFAYRDNLGDVVVQLKQTRESVRIKGNEFIEDVSLYRNRLAISSTNGIMIYEIPKTQSKNGLQYSRKDRVEVKKPFSYFQILTSNLLLSYGCKLKLCNFKGKRLRTWRLPGIISSLKILGGPHSHEGAFIGLETGEIYLIYINNSYPTEFLEHSSGVKIIDVSCGGKFLAIIDEEKVVTIYDIDKKSAVLSISEPSIGVKFHSEMDDVFSVTSKSGTVVRSIQNTIQTCPCKGTVVCIFGHYLLLYHVDKISIVDISFNDIITKYMRENRIFESSIMVINRTSQAVLKKLLYSSLCVGFNTTNLHILDRTEKCVLLDSIESSKQYLVHQNSKINSCQNLKPYIDAFNHIYSGNFEMATKGLIHLGEHIFAIDLLVSMWKWEEAKIMVLKSGNNVNLHNILRKEADWFAAMGEWEKASELYVACSEFMLAIEIIGRVKGDKWDHVLIQIVRKLRKDEVVLLRRACDVFLCEGMDSFVKEIYFKLDDYSNLLNLSMKNQNWLDVTEIINLHKEKIDKSLLIPYAEWLVEQERFEEAFNFYQDAGEVEKSEQFLLQLANNAIDEDKHIQASRFYWILWTKFKSQEYLVPVRYYRPPIIIHLLLRFIKMFDSNNLFFFRIYVMI